MCGKPVNNSCSPRQLARAFVLYTYPMSKGDPVPPLPADAPQAGEVYTHYKGDNYKVVGIALDSNDQWVVVYEPLYDGAVAKLFTRPAAEWHQVVEWQGSQVTRFTKSV